MKNCLLISLSLCFFGCAAILEPWVYKINIQQGNVIEKKQLDLLSKGMTKEQVAFVLGTPIVKDTFNTNRWDYVYNLKTARGKVYKDNLYVLFKDNRLVKMGGSYLDKYKKETAEKASEKKKG